MKTTTHIKTLLIQATLMTAMVFGASSCTPDPKTEDTKEIAQDDNQEKFDNTKKEKDALFFVYAAETNLKGIELGQLAQQKSKTEDIIKLGKMMEESHKKSLDELTTLAYKKSITIPKSLTDESQVAFKKLTDIQDVDFDKEYSDMMVKEHQESITEFDKAATESSDADIKAWAATTLPILHMHLDHSLICQKKYEKIK